MKMLTAILALASGPLMAQPCAPREYVAHYLAENHNETSRIVAIIEDGKALEFYASLSGGWTLTTISPDGISCIIAAGQGVVFTDKPS